MEALARWVDPQIGFLAPASFIPVLEQVRLIHQLDAYVLEEVCHMLHQRLNHDLPITPISFNLSRYDFDMVDVFHLVEKTRAAYQIPRDALHVEITESALAENDDPSTGLSTACGTRAMRSGSTISAAATLR